MRDRDISAFVFLGVVLMLGYLWMFDWDSRCLFIRCVIFK